MLMRHAKSDWDASYGTDHDRPLNDRGVGAARRMGRALGAMGEAPDSVVTSTAVRARTTAELAHHAGAWAAPIVLESDLYGAGPEEALRVAARHGGSHERLMLLGHEPTWSMLLTLLTGAHARMRTATVAAIDIDITAWDETPTAATLAYLIHPKLFENWDLEV